MPGDKRKNDSPHKDLQHPGKNQRILRSAMDLCRICKGSTLPTGKDDVVAVVKCTMCDDNFHINCVGVSPTFLGYYIQQKKKPWHCYVCDCELKHSIKANEVAVNKIEHLANQVSTQVKSISDEIMRMKQQDNSWKQEFECRISDLVDQRIEDKLGALGGNLTSQQMTVPHSNTASSFCKNLVISGIPLSANENVVMIVKKIAKQINFTLPNFIDNCFRVMRKESATDLTKPPIILLRFTTELARESFLKCYFSFIKKSRLTPGDVELSGTERIYINEHLDPELQPLLKIALAYRRSGKIAQVSSHSLHISIKMVSQGRSKWYRVKDKKSLDTLVGLNHDASEDEA